MKDKRIDWQKHARRRLFDKHDTTHMTRLDWLVMMLVTLVYAVIAFTNLGASQIPETHYNMDGDEIVVEFEQPEDISSIRYFTSLGTGTFSLFYSEDDEGYSPAMTQVTQTDDDGNSTTTMEPLEVEHATTDMYEWQFYDTSFTAKYVSIHVDEPGLRMLELGFCDAEGKPVPVHSVKNTNPDAERGNAPSFMFDEQQFVPQRTYYMTEMYFDEVYHARTAYENINHIKPYEITHPPLGKVILGIGIRLFGMNPFGWRCMGTLFGVLMLPLMYYFGKRLFKKTLYAFIPTALFALDFMHYTQTRIATIDSYSVFFIMLMYFFMYLYSETNFNRQPLKKSLLPLALCGVAFGLGAATKWLCIYAGAGLAVLLFMQLFKRYREYIYARETLDDENEEGMDPKRRAFLESVRKGFVKNTFITLLWCVSFFIVVPLIIYLLSYIPYMLVQGGDAYTFADVLRNQEYMLNYHSNLNPDSPHPFSSSWYLWPLDIRPVFFFQGKGYNDGTMSSMSTMGNPAIWWGALGSVIALIVIRIRKGRLGRRTLFLSIAALSEYLPWVLISRETYIYHYFATLPFLILLMAVLAKYLIERTRHGKKAVFIYLGVCLVLFVMFYPVTTGTVVSRTYSDIFLRWLPSWPFY